jgi:hypothetical protein
MQVINILDQLSRIYDQPTMAVLETNNTVFRSPYPDANAPEVLFCHIKEAPRRRSLAATPTRIGSL